MVGRGLVSSQLNNNFAAKPECIVEVEVTSRSSRLAIDCDTLDVCRCTDWNRLVHRFDVVVLNCDCGTSIHIAVMNGVLRYEGRKNEELRRGRDCEVG